MAYYLSHQGVEGGALTSGCQTLPLYDLIIRNKSMYNFKDAVLNANIDPAPAS